MSLYDDLKKVAGGASSGTDNESLYDKLKRATTATVYSPSNHSQQVQDVLSRGATEKQDKANENLAERVRASRQALLDFRAANEAEDGTPLVYNQAQARRYNDQLAALTAQLNADRDAQRNERRQAREAANAALKLYDERYGTDYASPWAQAEAAKDARANAPRGNRAGRNAQSYAAPKRQTTRDRVEGLGNRTDVSEDEKAIYDAYTEARRREDSARGRVSPYVGTVDSNEKLRELEAMAKEANNPEDRTMIDAAIQAVKDDRFSYNQNAVQRFGKSVASGAESFAGGFVGTARYLNNVNAALTEKTNEWLGISDKEYYEDAARRLSKRLGREITPEMAKRMMDKANPGAGLEAAEDKLFALTGQNARSAALGASKLEELGQQAVSSGVGMLGDAGLSLATGGMVNPLTSMGVRVFGQSAHEAKEKGAKLWQQGAYGLANAAVEVATEKMGGIGDFYGRGGIDRAVENWIGKVSRNATDRMALTLFSSFLSEGGEEVVSDLFAPAIEAIIEGNVADNYRQKDWSETFDSFLVGGLMGLAGGGTNVLNENYRGKMNLVQMVSNARKNSESEGQKSFDEQVIESGLSMDVNSEAYQMASELQDRKSKGQTLTDQELTDSVQATMRQALLEDEEGAKAKPGDAKGEKYVQRYVDGMGVDAESTKVLVSGFATSDLDAKSYTEGIQEIFEAGYDGIDYNQALQLSDASKVLNDQQFAQAYRIGQITYEVDAKNSEAQAEKNNNVEGIEHGEQTQSIEQKGADIETSDGGAERLAGMAAAGQSGIVAEGAGTAAQGRPRGAQAQRAAGVRAAAEAAGDLNSTKGAGFANGTSRPTWRMVNGTDAFTPEMKSFAMAWGRQGDGYKCVFISGNLEFTDESGKTFEARGAISPDGKSIYIRADHETLGWEQIAKHEQFHAAVKKDPALMQKLKEELKKKYGNGWALYLKSAYASMYFTDADGNITVDADYILEEIFADAYGGIDVLEGLDNVPVRATALSNDVAKGVSESKGDGIAEGTATIRFSADSGNTESKEILRIIHDNISSIPEKSVFEVKSKDVTIEGKKTDYVMEIFDRQGNIAQNKEIGTVELVKSGAKSTIMHGFGNVKLAAVEAIKPVIENGKIISHTENYNNTGVDRYVIAGKGTIAGEPAYVGAVVKSYPNMKVNSKFYLHEAEIIKADSPSMTAPQLSVDTVSESAVEAEASNNSMRASRENVKGAEGKNIDAGKQQVRFSMEDPVSSTTGGVISAKFKRWFGDPKKVNKEFVNADGTPKVFYHGTPNGDFTVFHDWQYFTASKDYADVYQGQNASTNPKKTANAPKTYEVYLAPKKVFDTRNPKERKIFMDEFYQKWGNGAPLSERGLPDWTDGDDFIEFFEENGYDYDAILLDEGATGGYGQEVNDRGISVVVRDSSAIKSATDNIGTFDRNNPDIRFSMDSPVEQTDRLVALHNKSTSGVMRMLERGGVPFPSIAIKKAGSPHEGFGDCTIVFPRRTIDPERNTWNRLYSNDAWTPTEPRTEYDVADTTSIKKKFENMLGADAYRALHGGSYLDDEQIAKDLRDSQGDIFEALKGRSAVKYGYLQSIGQRPEMPQTEKQLDAFGRYKNDQLTAIFDKIGGERIESASYDDSALLQEIADALNEQFAQKFGTKDPVFKKFKKNPLYTADDVRLANIQDAYRAWEDAGRTVPTVDDTYELDHTLKSNKDIENDENYKRWVENIFDGIISDSGISNGRDPFTPSGNRRSFKQTHVPATLENIVQQMRKENETGIGAIGGINLRGAATKNYSTVEDMRKDSSRLLGTRITDDVYDGYMKESHERLNDLVSTAAKEDRWQSRDSAEEIMLEAVRDCKTKRSMQTKLQKEAQWINYSEKLVDDLWQLKQDVQNMPAPYFEAKPRRTVRPDEAAAFIIPDNAPAKLVSMLEQQGLPYETYKAGDEADRLAKVNAVTTEESGTLFSRETPEDALRKQNEQLRKRAAYFQGQLKRTTERTVREGDISKLAAQMLKTYDSKADKAAVTRAMQELGNYIVNTDELSWGELKGKALEIARNIVENAQVLNDEQFREFEDVRNYLRSTKIRISSRDKASMGVDWAEFRRHNYGRMPKLGVSDTEGNVDIVFAELEGMFPGVFDSYEVNNPADQLLFIESFLDGIEPMYENPFSYNMAMAEESVANEMLDALLGEDVRQTAPTFADKAEQRLQNQKAKDAEKLREVKSAAADKLAAQRADANRRIREVKKNRDDAIADLKAHYAQQRRNAAERRADSAARTKLLKHAKRLMNKKLPAVNRAMLNNIIGDLDTVSKSMTGKTLDRLTNLRDWYEERKANDPDFLSDPGIEKAISRLSKRQINDLTQEEVADLTNILLNIENELETEHRLIDSEDRRETYHLGKQVIEDLKNVDGTGNKAVVDAWDKFVVTETLSPERQLHRMTGYNEDDPLYKLTKALSDGQRRMLDYQMKAQRPFASYAEDKEFNRRFAGKDADEIEITGYVNGTDTVKVKITPAMRASLYLHSLNDQNLKHIAEGGITIPDMKLYKKGNIAEAYARGTTVKLTPSMVRGIVAGMSEKERTFARKAHVYFNTTSREAINKVSEKLKGYSLAQVDNYFPINTDTSFTRSDFETLKMDGTIEGMGFLKDRVNASNPIMLRDANDVLEKSIQQHSKYVGLAIPVRNFNKVWNVTTSRYHDDGTRDAYTDSVQKAIKSKWGESGYNYIEKMMTDLQGGGAQNKNVWIKELNKIRSKYAGAVLTLNLSVAAKQAASYPTAAAVLGWEPLVKAMGNIGKVDLALIEKYTPLQWYRSQGFSTKELGDLKAADKQLPTVLNWVQGMDVLTTRKLWKASEYYVQQHNKELTIGSDAYYKAVAEIYNRVIEETQPNYTTMQRPQLLRSDDTLLGNLQMFKTQPFQNFNILYDAAGKLKAEMARGNPEAIAEARKNFANAVTSQLGQLAVFAGMTMAWAFFRGRDDKYRDDDGELTLKSVMSAYGKDMMGGLFSVVPFGSDAWELMSSKIFGDTYYGMDTVTITAVSDTLTSLNKLGDVIKDISEKAANGEKVDIRETLIAVDSSVDKISKLTGLPYENVVNTFNAAFRWAAKAAGGSYLGEYEAARLTVSIEKKRSSYYDLLYKAFENDDKQYAEIRQRMTKYGIDEDTIDNAMEKRIREAYFADGAAGGDYNKAVNAMMELAHVKEADAKKKVDGWLFENEHGFKPDKLKEKFIDGTVSRREAEDLLAEQGKNAKDIKKTMDAWAFEQEHGYAPNETKEKYLGDELSESEVKDALKDKGYDADKVKTTIASWNFEKQNGWDYGERKANYMDGDITASELRRALIGFGGMEAEDADALITSYDWEKKYGINVTAAMVTSYNAYCKATGISEKMFLEAKTLSNNTENDKDENGRTINYSAAKKVAQYINSLNLTKEQKTALAQSLGWSARTLRRVKLW